MSVFCYAYFTGPSALTVNVIKNIESSSIVIQWDAVDDSLLTTYTITWTRAGGGLQVATLVEQSSYTITGLTLDTVYTITVIAANRCGSGPEFTTSIILSIDTTSTTSSPIVPSTTTFGAISKSITFTTIHSYIASTTAPIMNPSTTATNIMITTVRRNIDTPSKTIAIANTDSDAILSSTTTTTTTTTVAKSSSSTVATIAVTDPKTGKFSVVCTITIIVSMHNCLVCSL